VQIDPKDLGPIGMVKSLVNAGLITGAVAIVLTWRDEFGSAASIMGVFGVALVACAIVEWIFRGYHKELADQVRASEERIKASNESANSIEMNEIRRIYEDQSKVYERVTQAGRWMYIRWMTAAKALEKQGKMVAPMLPTDTEGKIIDIPPYAILPLDHNPPAMDQMPELVVLVPMSKSSTNMPIGLTHTAHNYAQNGEGGERGLSRTPVFFYNLLCIPTGPMVLWNEHRPNTVQDTEIEVTEFLQTNSPKHGHR